VVEVTGYTAIVERSAPGWSIYVPQVDRHTWAAHLREIEDMARDLVQVMTDEPIETIELSVELPAELRNPIADMISTRASADLAETAARDAQRNAASALRGAGAPLRDIAAALGVSHQRVHQILADVAGRQKVLDAFKREVEYNLTEGPMAKTVLPVTADDGSIPIVAALGDELLSTLQTRLREVGGYGNVFVREGSQRVRLVAVVAEVCALGDADDDLTGDDDQPGELTTVSAFLDHVANHPGGVLLRATGRPVRATDTQPVELLAC
jgi:hypothetical protein